MMTNARQRNLTHLNIIESKIRDRYRNKSGDVILYVDGRPTKAQILIDMAYVRYMGVDPTKMSAEANITWALGQRIKAAANWRRGNQDHVDWQDMELAYARWTRAFHRLHGAAA